MTFRVEQALRWRTLSTSARCTHATPPGSRRLLCPRCSCRWDFAAGADEGQRGLLRGKYHGNVCRHSLIRVCQIESRHEDFVTRLQRKCQVDDRRHSSSRGAALSKRAAGSAKLDGKKLVCTFMLLVLHRQRSGNQQ